MSHRADALAEHLEAGVNELVSYLRNLTEAQWYLRCTDGRTVGVAAHHVAHVYPIEIEAAQVIARGEPFMHVTWDDIAALNARHLEEFKSVGKVATLELLVKNSRDAAEAIRALSDRELDRAAPFSLSYGAIVTAQFVVEDHAVRHAWHHLARIRAAVTGSSRPVFGAIAGERAA